MTPACLRRVTLTMLITASALLAAHGVCHAQTYPVRPVTLIAATSAGSQSDVLGRVLAEDLNRQWNQPVVIDNRPGASGFIAAEASARASPDGHTLFLGSAGIMAINPHVHPRLPYDPINGYAPVSFLGSSPYVIVVPHGSPVRTLADLVARAKAANAPLSYGSLGNGSTTHIAAEMFGRAAGIRLSQVPYKGDAQISTDLIGGQIDFSVLPTVTAVPFTRSGKLRPLAVTSLKRTQLLPEVPTVQELGYPGYELTQWFGVYAPASTPPAVVKAASEAVLAAVRRESTRNRIHELGADTQPMDATEFAAFHRAQYEKWRDTLKTLQIKLD